MEPRGKVAVETNDPEKSAARMTRDAPDPSTEPPAEQEFERFALTSARGRVPTLLLVLPATIVFALIVFVLFGSSQGADDTEIEPLGFNEQDTTQVTEPGPNAEKPPKAQQGKKAQDPQQAPATTNAPPAPSTPQKE
jgi:hypothetical protein